ncbi:MAG: hypothetical protein K6T83_15470 [Alicyclobacillus sp.]|nr:hypothetical protein [Alicyclobacillus sp.]
MANKQTVKFTVEPFGEFEARIRDFETDLRIRMRRDEQLWARNFDPNRASRETLDMFYALACFAETCEKTPPGFDVGELMRSNFIDAQVFLMKYLGELTEKEQSFRSTSTGEAEGKSVSSDSQDALSETRNPAMG